jgi:hypothetical protein
MYYKAPDNSLHFLESSKFEYLLPSGSISISDTEANTLITASHAVLIEASLKVENYKALIRRQADDLDTAGEPYKAIKLLKTIGE